MDATPSTPEKKARRQTAFYPNLNAANKSPKPFSRSAAKRESVLALGSIEHLQHYFTKTGIASKPAGRANSKTYVPALGPLLFSTSEDEHVSASLPPLPRTPMAPPVAQSLFQDHEHVSYTVDPDVLKPEVIADLDQVERIWDLRPTRDQSTAESSGDPGNVESSAGSSSTSPPPVFDVLRVLKTTTRTIRNVRNYVVSLPDDHPSHVYKSQMLNPGRHSKASSSASSSTQSGTPPREPDPLARIRKSALDVLTVLRSLEESSRISLAEDAYDSLSSGSGSTPALDGSSRSHTPYGARSDGGASPTPLGTEDGYVEANRSVSLGKLVVPVKIRGRITPVPVWSDDEDDDEDSDGGLSPEKEARWDDRLVLGGGWLYRTDIKLSTLTKEKEVVGWYLNIVDELLFEGTAGSDARGWSRVLSKAPRTSLGAPFGFSEQEDSDRRRESGTISRPLSSLRELDVMSEEPEEMQPDEERKERLQTSDGGIPDNELPDWAKREFDSDLLVRLHSLLKFHLHPDLRSLLPSLPGMTDENPPTSFRDAFLERLSDGQLLCVSYNSVVRHSKKPWGFIQPASIHDIVGLERDDRDRKNEEEGEDKKNTGRKTWTFRRAENLRLWAAALKLRYLIPLSLPGPSRGLIPSVSIGTPSLFDASLIAKREPGWEAMLEQAIGLWVEVVCKEKRGLGL